MPPAALRTTSSKSITKPEQIPLCDPAVGSGYRLTYAFDLLPLEHEQTTSSACLILGVSLLASTRRWLAASQLVADGDLSPFALGRLRLSTANPPRLF